jgi:hypothetical protein
VTDFEFVFSLFTILLGLALSEVLRGFARVIEVGRKVRVGWPTGLFAALVVADITLFWRVMWRARDQMPDTSAALFTALVISALYYFAAVLVFPSDAQKRTELESHFMAQKNKVLGCLFGANAIAYAGRYGLMGWGSFAQFPWYQTAEFVAFMAAALVGILASSRRALIAIVAFMLFIDLIDPVLSLFFEM